MNKYDAADAFTVRLMIDAEVRRRGINADPHRHWIDDEVWRLLDRKRPPTLRDAITKACNDAEQRTRRSAHDTG